jgi:hypothetical protein
MSEQAARNAIIHERCLLLTAIRWIVLQNSKMSWRASAQQKWGNQRSARPLHKGPDQRIEKIIKDNSKRLAS